MNKPNTEIRRWGIVVIQSLNPNDYKTGEILYHDILKYKEYHKSESFSAFYDVNSSDDFRLAVQDIENSLSEGDILTLQLETHGYCPIKVCKPIFLLSLYLKYKIR
ncbi:hypothetical protein HMPREF1860_01000 [Prevotella amnii]|uniref:Uncharacterized protein n=1 Tax=Prevotella amnii TaxID=419005 RepID=A0A134BEF7_9BACT|nr:hypothetical protein HMPREF1860_01000 [Prevotella amnii]